MRRSVHISCLAGALLAVGLGVTQPASASDQSIPTSDAVAPATIYGVAGYDAAFPGPAHVVATVEMPTLRCDPDVEEGIVTSVSLGSEDGYLGARIELRSYCHFGEPLRWGIFATDWSTVNIAGDFGDGDVIKVSLISTTNSGAIDMTVTNKTMGWTDSVATVGPFADHVYVQQQHLPWLTEDPLILRADTPVRHVKVGGADLASLSPTRTTLADETGHIFVKPSKIRRGTNFTFKYVGDEVTSRGTASPTEARGVDGNGAAGGLKADPSRRPTAASTPGAGSTGTLAVSQAASDPGVEQFHPYKRPVRAYTGSSCAQDFSSYEDGYGVGALYGIGECGVRGYLDQSLRKYTVPKGGWHSWGAPPHTESSTPIVLSASSTSVEIQLEESQQVGGIEIEPDPFKGKHSFTVEFYAEHGPSGALCGAITRSLSGRGGARLFGARVDEGFKSIVITSNDGVSFAVAQVRA